VTIGTLSISTGLQRPEDAATAQCKPQLACGTRHALTGDSSKFHVTGLNVGGGRAQRVYFLAAVAEPHPSEAERSV
jgi:hypothetical protein